MASLVLHYVPDWEAVLVEFRRVLNSEGTVVFSVHHPAMDWQLHAPDDYFAVRQVTETGKRIGAVRGHASRRPLTAMCQAIASAGFVIERLVEPAAAGGTRRTRRTRTNSHTAPVSLLPPSGALGT